MNFLSAYYINSKDRSTGQPSNNFTIATTSNLIGINNLAIAKVQFTNNIYPINANNNRVAYNDGANNLFTMIPHGSYSAANLATTVATNMSTNAYLLSNGTPAASSLTFTGSYNSTTGKITISSTGAFSLLFSVTSNSMASQLGFANSDYNSVSNSITSPFPVDIRYTRYIDICSRALTRYNLPSQSSDGKRGDILIRLPINLYRFGEEAYYEPRKLKLLKYNSSQILGNPDIVLYDEFGNLVDMNNSNFSLVFYLYE